MQLKTRYFTCRWTLACGLAAGLSLSLGLLGGCRKSPTPSADAGSRFRGQTLVVRCPSVVLAELVRTHGLGWESRQGAKIRCEVGEPNTEADVWLIPAASLPNWAASGKLRPVPGELLERGDLGYDWGDMAPLYRDHLSTWDGKVYGLPVRGDAPVLVYRKKPFADASQQKDFRSVYQRDLKPPETWEDFFQIASFFRASPGWNRAALTPLDRDPRGLEAEFYALAACHSRPAVLREGGEAEDREETYFSFYFDVKTGRPRIASKPFQLALEKMLQSRKLREQPRERPWEAFRAGEALFCLTQAWQVPTLQDGKSPVRDDFGVLPIPGSTRYFSPRTGEEVKTEGKNAVPYLGAGAILAVVPQSSNRSDAAFDFLAWLTGRSVSQQIVLEPRWGGAPVRQAHFNERWDSFGFKDAESRLQFSRAIHETLRTDLRNPVLCLRIPREAEFSRALTEELQKALDNRQATDLPALAQQTLTQVEKRWNDLIGNDLKKHQEAYATSLGLTVR